jgi:hypothetical protein
VKSEKRMPYNRKKGHVQVHLLYSIQGVEKDFTAPCTPSAAELLR